LLATSTSSRLWASSSVLFLYLSCVVLLFSAQIYTNHSLLLLNSLHGMEDTPAEVKLLILEAAADAGVDCLLNLASVNRTFIQLSKGVVLHVLRSIVTWLPIAQRTLLC